MRTILTSVLALCAASLRLHAQGYVGGFVLDSATKAPCNASRSPCSTRRDVVVRQLTIDNGAFQFDAPPRGIYRLEFALWNYEPLITASEELEPTTEHARTYAVNFRAVTDTARRLSRMRYADSASDAPPMPLLGEGKHLELPSSFYRQGPYDFTATFEVLVDSSGRAVPSSVKVTRSTHPAYGEAVEKFLKRAKFKPARLDHRPVCGWMRDEELVTHVYGRR